MGRGFTGVILAGGMSSRFGAGCKALTRDPAGLSWAGRMCVELHAAGASRVLVSCREDSPPMLEGIHRVVDLFPGKGPLGGIATASLELCGRTPFVFLPCDMPALNRSHVSELLRGLRSSPGSYLSCPSPAGPCAQPVCAALPGNSGETLWNALAVGHLSLTRLWLDLGLGPVMSGGLLLNVNSPADLAGCMQSGIPACS